MRFVVHILLLAMVTVVSSDRMFAQLPDVVGGLTVDAALNKVADRVDSSVEKAGATADGVVIRAGSDVNAEINNFREAYKDMLQKTVSSLDKEATKQLSQIFSDAGALEQKTAADAKRVLELAQQTANTIPFAKTRPQVTAIDPTYEVYSPTRKDDIALTVEGNFADIGDNDMSPYVEVEGKHVAPVHSTTQHLLFIVSRSVLAPNGKPTAFIKIPLIVPYKDGLIFKSRREARFSALLVGLPESPGKIVLEIRTSVPVSHTEHIRTVQYNLQSDRDDHVETICGPNEADPINPNSVRIVFDHVEGSSWTNHPVRVNNPSACYWLRTEHHGMGTSDKLWWHYEYDVTRSGTDNRTSEQSITLKWGESQTNLVSAGEFTIRFDAFDGSHQEYLAQNHDNRYIDISTDGGGLRIAARPVFGILPIQDANP